MVDYGIVLANAAVPQGTATAGELLDIAEYVDGSPGWSYLWVGDSLLSVPRLESVVLLAACAGRTSRVRLGVGCQASLGLRQPIVFAAQWASLDVLSAGRMTLVACTGPPRGAAVAAELAAFGLTHRERVDRMADAVALLRLASESDTVSYQGTHVSVEDIRLRPSFVQRPLPIWLAANPAATASRETVEKALSRVARHADGWMTFRLPAAKLRERLDVLAELYAAEGRAFGPDYPVCVYVDVNVGDDASALDDALRTCRQEGRRNADADSLRNGAAVGSVARCVDFVGELVRGGATNIAIRPVSQDPLGQVKAITEDLLPQLAAL